jgi:hypothetical protein
MDDPVLLERIAAQLVQESVIEAMTESGRPIEVWTIGSVGTTVSASAPRLEVASEMPLTTRLVLEDVPHQVRLVVDSATIKSSSRAAIELRVLSATADAVRKRATPRLGLAVAGTLTALVCDRLVPGEAVPARIADLSTGGLRATVADHRPRVGDRVRLHCRLFEGLLESDLRVLRAEANADGTIELGCAFIELDHRSAQVLDRVLERISGGEPPRQ